MQFMFVLKDGLDDCAHRVDRQFRRHGDLPVSHEPQPIVKQRFFFVVDCGLNFIQRASQKRRRNEQEHVGKRIEQADLPDDIVVSFVSGSPAFAEKVWSIYRGVIMQLARCSGDTCSACRP